MHCSIHRRPQVCDSGAAMWVVSSEGSSEYCIALMLAAGVCVASVSVVHSEDAAVAGTTGVWWNYGSRHHRLHCRSLLAHLGYVDHARGRSTLSQPTVRYMHAVGVGSSLRDTVEALCVRRW